MRKCNNCYNEELTLIKLEYKGREKEVCKECYKEIYFNSIVNNIPEYIKDDEIKVYNALNEHPPVYKEITFFLSNKKIYMEPFKLK